ncbi:MAG: hypothetical protein ACUVTO_01460 [Candidatus Caldatribacteriaceae bacterium]
MRRWMIALCLSVVLVCAFSVAFAVNLIVWSSPDNADALYELAQNFMQRNPEMKIEITPLS